MFGSEKLLEKWTPILEHTELASINDRYKKSVTAVILENQEKALREERQALNETAYNSTSGGVSNWDPILIGLVRRTMPNLIAFDIAGVQPMTGPTGLIFAMKSRYGDAATPAASTEALKNEANTSFSGADSGSATKSNDPFAGDSVDVDTVDDYQAGTGLSTAASEALGNTGAAFGEMGFTIEKATVTAKTRALKANYTVELAQDLKAIHGLDAETELANILSAEILAEINREIIRTINLKAKLGAQTGNVTTPGIFDLSTDADGRWSVEKFKGLIVQIEREANIIAKETRRGKGNFIITSSDVATALSASGMMSYAPSMSTELNVDDTGNTFAGVLNGRFKVYVDPYAAVDYVTVGYRGTNPYDAGIFYCPYVPLTMTRAIGEDDFQPRIGFKTRYGLVANPFVGTAPDNDAGVNRSNPYFRIFKVAGLLTA